MTITDKQFCILNVLHHKEGSVFDSSGYAMSRLFGFVKSSTTGFAWGENISSLLAELERKKLIRREINGKRTYEIRLTRKGEKAVQAHKGDGPSTISIESGTLGRIKSRLDAGWEAMVVDTSDEYEVIILRANRTVSQDHKVKQIRELMTAMYDGRITAPEVFNEIHRITE